MTRLDPLVARSLGATALSAAFAVLVTALIVVSAVVEWRLRESFNYTPPAVRRAVARCDAGYPPPRPIRTRSMVFTLYDGQTFRGAPASPVLSRAARDRLVRDERYAEPALWPYKQRITRLLSNGPCGVMSVSSARSPLMRPDSLSMLLALMGLAGAGASIAGYGIIARPLLRRVHSISRSAAAIGTPAFQLPQASEWDDLKMLTAALAAADQRIRTDESVLADRSQQLESVIASVAHDLKTPLATLQLMLQRLIDHPEPAEATRLGRAALDAAHSVGALLSNLEIDTQIKAGQLDAGQEVTDLRRLLEQLEIRFRVLGDLRQVEIRASWPDQPVWTQVDPTVAERILSNLIQNALTHGLPFGHVAVLLEAKPQTFRATITDDGPGFPADVVAAFKSGEPIVSAANPTRRPLGLAIVDRLCRHTGWTIELGRAGPASGASVVVSGPLSATGPTSARLDGSADPSNREA